MYPIFILYIQSLGRQTRINDIHKNEMLALDVFAESIKYLKTHALSELEKYEQGLIRTRDIQWVLTVPAIWEDSARQFMRLAAQQVRKAIYKNL